MGHRRTSRELAMQALFYMETCRYGGEEKMALFLKSRSIARQVRPFFLDLVAAVEGNKDRIDAIIKRFSSNWKISRMSGVDRNVLRVAVYEMLGCDDIPVKVSINEAIDIGKKFGTEASGAFINGILDSVRMAISDGDIQVEFIPPDVARKAFTLPEPDDLADAPPEPDPVSFTRVRGKNGIVKRRSTEDG